MIPGVAARRRRRRGSGEWIALADFVNGVYEVGGQSQTAAQVVSDTGRISSSGLSVLPGFGNAVDLVGSFRNLLFTAEWTAVFEVETLELEDLPASGLRNHLFMMLDDEGYEVNVRMGANIPTYFESSPQDGYTERFFDTWPGVISPGINKVAATRSDILAALSYNGEDALTDDTNILALDYVSAQTAFHTGEEPAGHIRRIEIYSPQPVGQLPILSAVETS
jgi:hypothetical protein